MYHLLLLLLAIILLLLLLPPSHHSNLSICMRGFPNLEANPQILLATMIGSRSATIYYYTAYYYYYYLATTSDVLLPLVLPLRTTMIYTYVSTEYSYVFM